VPEYFEERNRRIIHRTTPLVVVAFFFFLRNTLVVVAATENGIAETNSREHPIHTRDGPLTISCFTLLVGLLNQAQYARSYQGGPISDSRAQSGCHARARPRRSRACRGRNRNGDRVTMSSHSHARPAVRGTHSGTNDPVEADSFTCVHVRLQVPAAGGRPPVAAPTYGWGWHTAAAD
jgi:hypothetical protein